MDMDHPKLIDKSLKTSYSYLKNIIPNELVGKILDIAYDDFKNRYKNVLAELKIKIHPNFGKNCRFTRLIYIGGDPISFPILYRTTHKLCEICQNDNVSDYDFRTCHSCASKSEFLNEFTYYHRLC